MWLIDEGGEALDVCIVPLAYAFLILKGILKTEEEKRECQQNQINLVISKLLKDFTANDITILEESINFIESIHKNEIISIIYQNINRIIKPNTIKKTNLFR
jgi:hypothetical protein